MNDQPEATRKLSQFQFSAIIANLETGNSLSMQELRRLWLKGTGATLLAPLLGPSLAFAREPNANALTARTISDALKAYGANNASETRDILINAPEIAENGSKVEVEAICNLPNAKSLAVFADRNPMPLCATFDFNAPMLPYAKVQLKLAESMRLRVVAKTTDGKSHVAFRDIKVTLGGCGG